MKNLKGSTRTYLRGLAHKLKPVVQVGKNGLTEDLYAAINEALESHELIKLKFIDYKESKKEFSQEISDKTKSELLGIIGNIAIYFRQNPDIKKRKIKVLEE